jgi:hypothetical protein
MAPEKALIDPLLDANRGGRNRTGWRTGLRAGEGFPSPHGPPNGRYHATDEKKPQLGGRPPETPGRQSRMLDLQHGEIIDQQFIDCQQLIFHSTRTLHWP